MPSIDPTNTLAELVTDRPELASLFDSMGLDYCCGGQRSLLDATDAAGLDLGATLATLLAAPAHVEQRWDGADIAGLVDHLEATHHSYLKEALPRLETLADKVAEVHGANHPELQTVLGLVREIHADLQPHLMKEERILFPMIRELATAGSQLQFHCGSLSNPIRVMLSEHDNVGEILAQMRAITDGYSVPDDGCASYQALYSGLAKLEADTHMHVHKENNLLFPAVLAAEEALA